MSGPHCVLDLQQTYQVAKILVAAGESFLQVRQPLPQRRSRRVLRGGSGRRRHGDWRLANWGKADRELFAAFLKVLKFLHHGSLQPIADGLVGLVYPQPLGVGGIVCAVESCQFLLFLSEAHCVRSHL